MKSRKHHPFPFPLVFLAITLGVFGGFGIGAYMVLHLAFGTAPALPFGPLIQIHGHLQLFAWTGFFIIAVSLYKLPRLTSSPPIASFTQYFLLSSLCIGLLLRTLGQLLSAGVASIPYSQYISGFGGLLECIAIVVFAVRVQIAILHYRGQSGAIAARAIKPFLVVAFWGWLAYAASNFLTVYSIAQSPHGIPDPTWSRLAIDIYINMVLLPTCFAYSLSTFPIFLRTPIPSWSVVSLAYGYTISTLLYLGALHLPFQADSQVIVYTLASGLRFATFLWLVLKLDLLHIRSPWIKEKLNIVPAKPLRNNSSFSQAFGQFGNFEWLIYAAYVWLLLAGLADLLLSPLTNLHHESIVRHLFLLGFTTHLILGMAVRMIPGFLGKNYIEFPSLVRSSFFLIIIATLFRIVPLLLPQFTTLARIQFGASGILAILALLCLACNLAFSFLRDKRDVKAHKALTR